MARSKFADPAFQAEFLCALDATRMVKVAATAIGITMSVVVNARRRIPGFDAAVVAVLARPIYGGGGRRRLLPFQRIAFLDALAESGCAVVAGRRSRVAIDTVYHLKRRDAHFAAAWADARDQANDRAYGRMLDAAINGFVRTETSGDTVKRIVTHEPRSVLALLDRNPARAGTGRGEMVELTPELAAQARATLLRRLTSGGGLTTMAEAIEHAAAQVPTEPAS